MPSMPCTPHRLHHPIGPTLHRTRHSHGAPGWVALVLAVLLLAAPWALQAARYNFDYRSSGEPALQPTQVFDDGHSTYFQWPARRAAPAIFLDTGPSGLQLQLTRRQGDCLVVPTRGTAFVLRFGQLEARVQAQAQPSQAPQRPAAHATDLRLAGAATAMSTTTATATTATTPSTGPLLLQGQQHPNYQPPAPAYGAARPLQGDGSASAHFTERELGLPFAWGQATLDASAEGLLTRLLPELRAAAQIIITGREDGPDLQGLAHARALALQDWLLAAGLPLERLVRQEKPGPDADTPSLIAPAPSAAAATHPASLNRLSSLRLVQRQIPEASPSPTRWAAAAPVRSNSPTWWQLSASDQTLEQLLARWAKTAGWRLHWQASAVVPITGDALLERSGFLQAADTVVQQARALGHPIKATAYSNQVLVIRQE